MTSLAIPSSRVLPRASARGRAPRPRASSRRVATATARARSRVDDDDDADADDHRLRASSGALPALGRREAIATPLAAAAALAATALTSPLSARAEYGETTYMGAIADKDYGKKDVIYEDFTLTPSGLQYKDMKPGAADGAVVKKGANQTVVIDWDGYTIGYYGRPFEARNKSKGGAFTGEEKDFVRFKPGDPSVIAAFNEAIVGMTVGSIRRIVVPPNTPTRALGYPDGKAWRSMKPQPSSFSGERALGFVLENQGMIDKTLLFDIELIKIIE